MIRSRSIFASRSAFTLIELLVVIAIISMLIGLLIPAVQKVRDASARMRCLNNLKQIGIATNNYVSTVGNLPPGGDANHPVTASFSAQYFLLPYIEQNVLFSTINFSASPTSAANSVPAGTTIPIFICPADTQASAPAGMGGNNYVWNYGSDVAFFSTASSGPFMFGGTIIKMTDISDGTSTTAAFCERRKGDFNNAVVTPATDLFNGGAASTPDQAVSVCNALDTTNLSNQWRSDFGAYWIQAYHWTLYQHVNLPNSRSCAFPPANCAMSASSSHTNGVNLLLCDGSARFVTNGISMSTWRALGTRSNNDLLGNDY